MRKFAKVLLVALLFCSPVANVLGQSGDFHYELHQINSDLRQMFGLF